jgi:hypothetical protein
MVTIGALNERRTPSAGIVARAFTLNFNDVGTEIGQHLSGPGAGKDAGEFKDPEAL